MYIRHLKCKIYKLKNEQKQSHKVITSLNCNRNTENCDFMNHNTVLTYCIICIFFLKKKAYLPTLPFQVWVGQQQTQIFLSLAWTFLKKYCLLISDRGVCT